MIILESNEFTRLGLKAALQISDAIESIGDYEDIDMMMADMSRPDPDVIILGGNEDISDKTSVCQSLKASCPDAEVLTLTDVRKIDELHEIILSGATGNVQRNADADELIRCIDIVASGGLCFDRKSLQDLLNHLPSPEIGDILIKIKKSDGTRICRS